MEKIVIVSATNRPDSNTLKVSHIYEEIVKNKAVETDLLDFRTLPPTLAFSETFGQRSAEYAQLINRFVSTQNKFIFVIPEYNGSFPGILKTFLDSVPPREWAGKKVCMVGVADGRAGNLRGTEHLTGVLHYLKMHVYHHKLPFSLVNKLLAENGGFNNEEQLKVCTAQVEGFLSF
jgi:chromate reductase